MIVPTGAIISVEQDGVGNLAICNDARYKFGLVHVATLTAVRQLINKNLVVLVYVHLLQTRTDTKGNATDWCKCIFCFFRDMWCNQVAFKTIHKMEQLVLYWLIKRVNSFKCLFMEHFSLFSIEILFERTSNAHTVCYSFVCTLTFVLLLFVCTLTLYYCCSCVHLTMLCSKAW